MTKLIKLPDGNAIATEVVRAVLYVPGKGVICRDAQSRVVGYIKEPEIEIGNLIRDVLIKVVEDGRGAIQPDWSFLQKAAE